MCASYHDLGAFSDWVAAAGAHGQLGRIAAPGPETQQRVREVIGFCGGPEEPRDVRVEGRWERDGVAGEAVSWSVGYGPRTAAWVLRPAGAAGPLPGVIALHDHGSYKYYGKEKIADGPDGAARGIEQFRRECYGGRAFADDLARAGFVVLTHDVFLWGSRRFSLETIPALERAAAAAFPSWWYQAGELPDDIAAYNAAAELHEHLIAKYCALLGTTLAGVIAYEDRLAARYLAARDDVLPGWLGCIGLSGGGCRSALLQATCDAITAAVIIAMMGSYPQMFDRSISGHTWMLFPHGWARYGDWPDLAACRAPSPLLVQYGRDDALFTPPAMEAAHRRIAGHYAQAGDPRGYHGVFYPGPHHFDEEMQTDAFHWLAKQSKRSR